MIDFAAEVRRSIIEGGFLKLTLSRPVSPNAASRVGVRRVEIAGGMQLQFAFREGTQERHENHVGEAAVERILSLFPSMFAAAHLFTAEADYAAEMRGEGKLKVRRSAPTQKPLVELSHNRTKRYTIPEGVPCPFLVEIGVMTAAGRVRADRQHKFRQINRYLEFVEDILPDLPAEGPLHVVDFGCGKSSLTFAVHHLLTAIHGREVRMLGLDRNPSVIETCRGIAERLRCRGLEFAVGDIAQHQANERVHLAVSLHACDTATDFTLAKAIGWGADVILAVPCCQHELAPQLRSEDLEPLLRHGILRERFASLATDALRAACLDAAGYRTQVIEFIDLDHTPKNLLLRATRRRDRSDEEVSRQKRLAVSGMARMMQSLSVEKFTLFDLLGLDSTAPAGPEDVFEVVAGE
jgi:SAM-dependent methyltransferase